eukprot:gnl/TRDRNA2_/TRDRNA2_84924_c1_seq1.p1 gnl/TRDRNA2_/TRDRNA2_84924_c1~~gnl/TRDRNA2_/TRDRNA2_84924_c1_seq1.p1  ORF type:complete len:178 (-),score=18.74 gnl/TRDRNA2_/TRDRNA2_84924_c1_seq1:192-725(-)
MDRSRTIVLLCILCAAWSCDSASLVRREDKDAVESLAAGKENEAGKDNEADSGSVHITSDSTIENVDKDTGDTEGSMPKTIEDGKMNTSHADISMEIKSKGEAASLHKDDGEEDEAEYDEEHYDSHGRLRRFTRRRCTTKSDCTEPPPDALLGTLDACLFWAAGKESGLCLNRRRLR